MQIYTGMIASGKITAQTASGLATTVTATRAELSPRTQQPSGNVRVRHDNAAAISPPGDAAIDIVSASSPVRVFELHATACSHASFAYVRTIIQTHMFCVHCVLLTHLVAARLRSFVQSAGTGSAARVTARMPSAHAGEGSGCKNPYFTCSGEHARCVAASSYVTSHIRGGL